jgi:hypothetical protein
MPTAHADAHNFSSTLLSSLSVALPWALHCASVCFTDPSKRQTQALLCVLLVCRGSLIEPVGTDCRLPRSLQLLCSPMFLLAICSNCCLLHAGFFLGLLFNPEGSGSGLHGDDRTLVQWQTSPAGYEYEVLTVATVNSTVFWDVTPCSMVAILRSTLGRRYGFHLKGQRGRQASSGSSFQQT